MKLWPFSMIDAEGRPALNHADGVYKPAGQFIEATLPSDNVEDVQFGLAAGGYYYSELTDVAHWSERDETWVSLQSLPNSRNDASLFHIGDYAYVAGGYDGSNELASVVRYNKITDSWTEVAPLPSANNYCWAGSYNGEGYFFGSDYVYIYDPDADSWTQGASMPYASRTGHGGGFYNGEFYLFGGRQGTIDSTTNRVDKYDPATDTFTTGLTGMPKNLTHPATVTAARTDGRIHSFGGEQDDSTGAYNHYIYDPAADSWEDAGQTPQQAEGGIAWQDPDGLIHLTGLSTAKHHVYDPSSGSWSEAQNLTTDAQSPADGLAFEAPYSPSPEGVLVSATNPDSIGYDSVTLQGSLDTIDTSTDVSVDCWFALRQTGTSTWQRTGEVTTLTSTGTFTETITGLDPNTGYEIVASAEASNGDTDRTDTLTFTTDDLSPIVSTGGTDSISYTQATVTGTLDDIKNADSADVWFTYRQTGAQSWTATSTQILTATGSFNETITELTQDTEYELRAHASTDTGGTTVTDPVTFMTAQSVPEVTADGVTFGSDMTTADLNATAVDFGNQTEAQVWFEYGPSGNVSANTTTKQTLSTTGSFTHSVSGLTTGQTYDFRANISTSDGETATSATSSFTTEEVYTFDSGSSIPPTGWQMTNLPTSELSYSTAQSVSGNRSLMIDNGGSNSINHGQGSSEFTSALKTTGNPVQPHQLEFNYSEPSSNTGGIGFWAVDSSGNKLFGVGSTNPGPVIYGGNGESSFSSYADYNTWYKFEIDIDWANGEFTATWDGQESLTGSFIDSGAADVAELHVGCFGSSMNGKLAGVNLDDISRIIGDLLTTETTGVTPSVTTADLTGELVNLGGASSVEAHFEYRETGGSTWNTTSTQTLSQPQSFTDSISGLTGSTDYEYRAVIDDGSTQDFGGTATFTTLADTTVTTASAVTGGDATTATLNGSLTSMGDASSADVYFEWGPTGSVSQNQTTAETLTAAGDFSHTITGLTAGTDYDFRAKADASDGDTDTGNTTTFTANNLFSFEGTGSPPAGWEVTNLSADSLSQTADRSLIGSQSLRIDNGGTNTINHGQGANEFTSGMRATGTPARPHSLQFGYYEIGTDTGGVGYWAVDSSGNKLFGVGGTNFDPVVYDANGETQLSTGSEFRWYSFNIDIDWANGEFTATWDGDGSSHTGSFIDSGAADVAEVHVGAFGANMNGKMRNIWLDAVSGVSGNLLTVEPTGATPGITTADLSGELVGLGGASSADVYFEYRQTGTDTWQASTTQTLSSAGTFTESLSGLTQDTGYEYRAVAEGGSMTETSNVMTFATTPDTTVKTRGVDMGTDATTATLKGELTAMGDATSADLNFQWGPTGNVTANETSATSREQTDTYESSVFGLTEGSEYDYRAYATASDGDTDTGATKTFTAVTTTEWTEGFESGNTSDSTFTLESSASVTNSYAYNGSYSFNASDSSSNLQATASPFSSNVVPDELSFYYREPSSGQTGGGVRLLDDSGNAVAGFLTNNPQWEVVDANGNSQIGVGSYNTWTRVRFYNFDFSNQTFDVEVQYADGSNTVTATGQPIINSSATGIYNVEITRFSQYTGSNINMFFDEFYAIYQDSSGDTSEPITTQ